MILWYDVRCGSSTSTGVRGWSSPSWGCWGWCPTCWSSSPSSPPAPWGSTPSTSSWPLSLLMTYCKMNFYFYLTLQIKKFSINFFNERNLFWTSDWEVSLNPSSLENYFSVWMKTTIYKIESKFSLTCFRYILFNVPVHANATLVTVNTWFAMSFLLSRVGFLEIYKQNINKTTFN